MFYFGKLQSRSVPATYLTYNLSNVISILHFVYFLNEYSVMLMANPVKLRAERLSIKWEGKMKALH